LPDIRSWQRFDGDAKSLDSDVTLLDARGKTDLETWSGGLILDEKCLLRSRVMRRKRMLLKFGAKWMGNWRRTGAR